MISNNLKTPTFKGIISIPIASTHPENDPQIMHELSKTVLHPDPISDGSAGHIKNIFAQALSENLKGVNLLTQTKINTFLTYLKHADIVGGTLATKVNEATIRNKDGELVLNYKC